MASRNKRGMGLYPPSAYFIAAIFYFALSATVYLFHYGLNSKALLCSATLKMDNACPGNTGDLAIFKALLDPLSPQVLAFLLLIATLFAAGGMVMFAIDRQPEIKSDFRRALVLNGFFYGYIMAKFLVAWIYHEPAFASGVMFGIMSFLYLYFLYMVSQHIPAILPAAKTYSVQYGFMFDSLFAIAASFFFTLGFDADVNVGLSGAAFIICAFGAMTFTDAFMFAPIWRFYLAMSIVTKRLDNVPVPERNWRMLLSALWATYKELRKVPSNEILDGLQREIEKEDTESSLTPDMEAEVRREMSHFMTILLLLWPVVIYVIYRYIAILILRWIGV
jgi:hypothetical protein